MKFDTSSLYLIWGLFLCIAPTADASDLRKSVLRDAAREQGFVPSSETHVVVSNKLVDVGKILFESKDLSLDRSISCASCHVDEFGSADGLPNAVGVGGEGIGTKRFESGGNIIPRNTLPFWGRGGKGFSTFFWDGKVELRDTGIHSQFAGQEPSKDPLVVAIHLPPVELGEMLGDSANGENLETETVASAQKVYSELVGRIRTNSDVANLLAKAKAKSVSDLTFTDIAEAIAAFIRQNFRLKETRFEKFVFADGELNADEIAGGLLFYGKGRCSTCHNGPYFSDFEFHAIPFPQIGFGKNGFGSDYGRFNVTLNYDDIYKFRTPPLQNVTKTAPYSHSGSVTNLTDAIQAHLDPLRRYNGSDSTEVERGEFYQRLKLWASEPVFAVSLDDQEIKSLVAFLSTLEYKSDVLVKSD